MRRSSVAFLVAFLAVGATTCGGAGASVGPGEAAGGPSGSVSLAELLRRDVYGEEIRRGEIDGARVVLLDFWATWCKPCKAELPLLSDLQARYEAAGLRTYAVALDEAGSAAAVQEYAEANRFAFRVLHDEDGALARDLNPRLEMPYTLLLKNGRIVRTHRGFSTADFAELEAEVRELLETP
jgi:thiol-disulfide isomerase/thioredoxin